VLSQKRYFSGLSRSTFLLALASLFSDTSTEMLYPILPLFLTQALGATAGQVGIVEGIAPAIQNVLQGLSGWLSDKMKRRKPLALIGFGISAVAKPLMGLATGWTGILAARSFDRLGAGTRSAPRDALVAASVRDEDRGKAFGLEGFGDNLGAFLGPLVAIALLGWFHASLRSIFVFAAVPGALAAAMVAFVREKPSHSASKSKLDLDVTRLPKDYWRMVIATALFGIGNSTNAFLVLRTKTLGASLATTIFIYAGFNLVAALASYPAGGLSDKLGRKGVLLLSMLAFIVTYLGFALTSSVGLIAVLFALYGLHAGAFRSVGKALATDSVPEHLRATAVGWYGATLGLSGLIASVVGGELWTRLGPPATFFYGAGWGLVGIVAVIFLVPAKRA
jgi:MFS family permease